MKLRKILAVYAGAFALALVASCTKNVEKAAGVGATPVPIENATITQPELAPGSMTASPTPAK